MSLLLQYPKGVQTGSLPCFWPARTGLTWRWAFGRRNLIILAWAVRRQRGFLSGRLI